jgi:hypothetical protein
MTTTIGSRECINMMKRLIYISTLLVSCMLTPCLSHGSEVSGNLSIDVVPPGTTPPPQATAAGFTTLAFNGDMTQGFDVSCANPATGPHQWYLGGNGLMNGSCANLTYPHIDETDGSKVLQIHLGPSTAYNGGIGGRVGIATSDLFGGQSHNFPINAYFECEVRLGTRTAAYMAAWHNCWMGDWHGLVNGHCCNAIEYDMTEFHGGYFNNEVVAGTINWECGGPGSPCLGTFWGGNIASIVPGYDPTRFHRYGMLMYQTTASNLHVRGYVDDILIHEGDVLLSNAANGSPNNNETAERPYIVVDLTSGCNFDEGQSFYCLQQPIDGVFGDGSGKLHITTPNATMFFNFLLGIDGANGIPTLPNGSYRFHQDNWAGGANGNFGCVDSNGNTVECTLSLYDANTGKPIKMAGSYTGGGVVNQWLDPGYQVFVKRFRVFTCASWRTTECSSFNPN